MKPHDDRLISGLNTPPKITNLNNTLTLPELTPGRKLVYKINYVDNEADSIQFEIVNYEDVNGVFDIILSSKILVNHVPLRENTPLH